MKKFQVLLDMDEVLADFVGGVAAALGVPLDELLTHWKPGDWGIHKALSGVYGSPMTEGEFWAALRAQGGRDFWSSLPVLPWAGKVLSLVDEFAGTGGWLVVTTPSDCPGCIAGKKRWIERHFGVWGGRLKIMSDKPMAAKEHRILIDDNDAVCDEFAREGGRAIVFPRYHNLLHHLKDDPVGYVRKCLEYLKNG